MRWSICKIHYPFQLFHAIFNVRLGRFPRYFRLFFWWDVLFSSNKSMINQCVPFQKLHHFCKVYFQVIKHSSGTFGLCKSKGSLLKALFVFFWKYFIGISSKPWDILSKTCKSSVSFFSSAVVVLLLFGDTSTSILKKLEFLCAGASDSQVICLQHRITAMTRLLRYQNWNGTFLLMLSFLPKIIHLPVLFCHLKYLQLKISFVYNEPQTFLVYCEAKDNHAGKDYLIDIDYLTSRFWVCS